MSLTPPKTAARLALGFLILAGPGVAQERSSPGAQPPSLPLPPAAAPLPRAFAGYAQPAIPPSACQVVSAAETRCIIPANTAGHYLIEAAGSSTAQGAGAAQALQIVVADQVCGIGRHTQGTWSSGRRTFRFDCAVTFLADQPVTVRVIYADEKAVKDPGGPIVAIRPLPWNGVLATQPFAPKQ
jgi:hypothetical protein